MYRYIRGAMCPMGKTRLYSKLSNKLRESNNSILSPWKQDEGMPRNSHFRREEGYLLHFSLLEKHKRKHLCKAQGVSVGYPGQEMGRADVSLTVILGGQDRILAMGNLYIYDKTAFSLTHDLYRGTPKSQQHV